MNIQRPEQAFARIDAFFGPQRPPQRPSARDAFVAGLAGGAIRGIAGAALQPVVQNQLNGDRVAVVQARHRHHHRPAAAAAQGGQVPDGVAVGGVEILGGALLMILTPVFPIAGVIGGWLVADGLNRTFNGIQENPNPPNGQNPAPPPPQGGVNF